MTNTNENLPRSPSDIALDIRMCQKCPLHATRLNTVPGEGPDNPKVMIIGEGPGKYEDQKGQPFVGASGNQLNKLLADNAHLARKNDVFITNVVKCRTPDNRDPTPAEVEACRPWLEEQIDVLKPPLIVTLGNPATRWFRPGTFITKVRGRVDKVADGRIILPTMHPAAAFRKRSLIDDIEKDFGKIPFLLEILNIDPDAPNPHPHDLPPTPPPPPPPDPYIIKFPPLPDDPAEAGPILLAADWLQQEAASILDTNAKSGDSRRARHHMNTLSHLIVILFRHVDKMEQTPYVTDMIRPRLRSAIAFGQHANPSVVHVCSTCHQGFYSDDTTNSRHSQCPNCS